MKYLLVLLYLPQCFGIGVDQEVSDSLIILNTSQIGGVDLAFGASDELARLSIRNNSKFNMPALISSLAGLSTDPDAMLNVITLLSHMIYEATLSISEIEDRITQETENIAVLNDEISMLHSVIGTLGGDNLDCLQGAPHDSCGRLWTNRMYVQGGVAECLSTQRALYENSVEALAVMYRATDGDCLVYDLQRFDECPNISWQQSDFGLYPRYQTCRVSIE